MEPLLRLLRVVLLLLTDAHAITCDDGHIECTADVCLSPSWPHERHREVIVVGDDLMAPSNYDGECSPVSQRIADDTALAVENAATVGASLRSGLSLPSSFAAGVDWVVISGGLNDILNAAAARTSLNLDTLMSAYDSGSMAEVVASAVQDGARVALVEYPIDRRIADGLVRGQYEALMDRFERFTINRRQKHGENVYFVRLRDVSSATNASLFAADLSRPSWRGGALIGSRVASLVAASLAAPEEVEYEETAAPVTCYLGELLASGAARPALAECTTLDLQGALRPNSSTIEAANMTLNATMHLLVDSLLDDDRATPRLSTLLLSTNPSLSEANATARVAAALSRHRHLQHMTLDGCDLSAADVDEIARALLAPRTDATGGSAAPSPLLSLSLSYNSAVGAAGAASIAAVLRDAHRQTALQALHLSSCGIGSGGAAALAEAFASGGGGALERLALDANGMDDEGAVALARALRVDNHTTHLELSANQIGRSGVAALAAALTPMSTEPTALTLRGSEGYEARGSALRTLNLNSNAGADAGAAAMASMLRLNTRLSSLRLWDNGVSRAGAEAMAQALEANYALTRLALVEHNDIASAYGGVARRLDALVARNAEAHEQGGDPLDGQLTNYQSALSRDPEAGLASAYVLPRRSARGFVEPLTWTAAT